MLHILRCMLKSVMRLPCIPPLLPHNQEAAKTFVYGPTSDSRTLLPDAWRLLSITILVQFKWFIFLPRVFIIEHRDSITIFPSAVSGHPAGGLKHLPKDWALTFGQGQGLSETSLSQAFDLALSHCMYNAESFTSSIWCCGF